MTTSLGGGFCYVCWTNDAGCWHSDNLRSGWESQLYEDEEVAQTLLVNPVALQVFEDFQVRLNELGLLLQKLGKIFELINLPILECCHAQLSLLGHLLTRNISLFSVQKEANLQSCLCSADFLLHHLPLLVFLGLFLRLANGCIIGETVRIIKRIDSI